MFLFIFDVLCTAFFNQLTDGVPGPHSQHLPHPEHPEQHYTKFKKFSIDALEILQGERISSAMPSKHPASNWSVVKFSCHCIALILIIMHCKTCCFIVHGAICIKYIWFLVAGRHFDYFLGSYHWIKIFWHNFQSLLQGYIYVWN
jgi:hypothetical protein